MTAETQAGWIGRGHTRTDVLSDRLIEQFRATLPEVLAPGPVPPGLFWALAPDALPPADLGRDGHPRLGVLLPDLPLRRRMWAGGEVMFHGDFAPGDSVTRDTRIERIEPKKGGSGPLIFVALRHVYRVSGRDVVTERQDLVYRPDPDPATAAPAPPPVAPDLGAPVAAMELATDPVRLFRFSALTFNGHRIHYDADYARDVEGYAGLVVHGPMQAVAMLNLAARVLERCPSRFVYRGLVPLIAGEAAVVEAHRDGDALSLRVRKCGGPVTMGARADA